MSAGSERIRRAISFRNAGVYYALVGLLATFTIIAAVNGKPFYLDGRNLANLTEQAALVGILAVFMTVVLVTGNFDLSVGATAAVAAAAAVIALHSLGIVGAILVAMLVGALVGVMNGVLVQFVGINAFIVTLGTMTMIRGVFLAVTNGRSVRSEDQELVVAFRDVVLTRLTIGNLPLVIAALAAVALVVRLVRERGRVDWRSRPDALLVIALVVAAVLAFATPFAVEMASLAWYFVIIVPVAAFVMARTVLGRRVYAVGGNCEAAVLAGIAAPRYRLLAFVASGTAAGFVGAMFAARTGTVTPSALMNVEMTVIAACVLGGVSLFGGSGSILKSIAGVFILFTLSNGFNMLNIGANYQQLIQGAIIVASAAVYTVADRRARTVRRTRGDGPVLVVGSEGATEVSAEAIADPPMIREDRAGTTGLRRV